MGGSQSQPSLSEEQRKCQQETERQKRVQEEEIKQNKKQNDLFNKKLEFQHIEEMQKLANQEKKEERSDALEEKRGQLEHERLCQTQDKVLSIKGNLFQKVETNSMADIAFLTTTLQSIQAGKPVDKDVLKAVTDKVPNPAPADIKQLVHNVIRACEEAEENDDVDIRDELDVV